MTSILRSDYHTPRIVGHCIGAGDKTCGKPLASKAHARALGAYPNSGGMRCRSCYRRNVTLNAGPARLRDLPALPHPGEWVRDARCAQVDPDLFFPERGGSNAPAKMVCRGCPVLAQCRNFALEHGPEHGIWAALSAPERERLRQEQGQVAA